MSSDKTENLALYMLRTPEQNKALYALVGALKISDDQKEALVWSYSNNRTIHSSELSYDECKKLIRFLQGMQNQMKSRKDIATIKMRFRFYYTLRDKGWLPELPNDEAMKHLDAFTLKIWHKEASGMNEKELGIHIGIVKRWKTKNVCPKS